ncbi:hypothetical protein BKA65DRAFT_573415 [Rhexocercosporidium sp. MPI-PUGE-AT-0058]|nr:hypothetical protein BKA65DRAFT_573415 [Rhexocercosporidium sp. MPI-PUGE-AT-0058]
MFSVNFSYTSMMLHLETEASPSYNHTASKKKVLLQPRRLVTSWSFVLSQVFKIWFFKKLPGFLSRTPQCLQKTLLLSTSFMVVTHQRLLNAYNYTRRFEDFAICFTQPHRDLEEVRLAGWILSIVIADLKNANYLWSSDSDTIVLPVTISNCSKIVAAKPAAAGASALVELSTSHVSFIGQMAQTAYNWDEFLNRSALGALGASEYLKGPGLLFRIAALRTVAASW